MGRHRLADEEEKASRIHENARDAGQPGLIAIRPDERNRVDDIAVENVSLFRLEVMSTPEEPGLWWLGLYRGARRLTFHITSESPIVVTVQEDELGDLGREPGSL